MPASSQGCARLVAYRSELQRKWHLHREAACTSPPALLTLKAQPGVAHGRLRAVRKLAGIAALVQRARLTDVAQRPLHGNVCRPRLRRPAAWVCTPSALWLHLRRLGRARPPTAIYSSDDEQHQPWFLRPPARSCLQHILPHCACGRHISCKASLTVCPVCRQPQQWICNLAEGLLQQLKTCQRLMLLFYLRIESSALCCVSPAGSGLRP
jgi:hypothetical protein